MYAPVGVATSWRRLRHTAVLALGLVGCHWVRSGNPAVVAPVAAAQVKAVGDCAPCRDSVDIVAMGVHGFLMVPWRDSTELVMTPPSYTNPTLPWMLFGNWLLGSHPNSARIERRLRDLSAASFNRLAQVRAVLVGHGHYDHLMDLPYLAPYLPNATVYGSSTVVNMLAPARGFAGRLRSVDSSAGIDASIPGQSIAIGRTVTVRAIAWAHAPNIGSHVIARGERTTPRTALPRGVFGWKLGRVYAYAIDILDADGLVGGRIVVHDAAAPPDVVQRAAAVIGTFPAARSTTLIITAANFDQVPQYPELLLTLLAPTHVLLGHWEDFFRSPEKPERVVRGIRARTLVDHLTRVQGSRWTALNAGATLRVRW